MSTNMLLGIKAGQSVSGQAGANCRRVSLAVDADGQVATIGDRKIGLSPGICVLWHADDAGTFHGFACPEQAKTVATKELPPVEPTGVVATSSSGGNDFAAAVFRVPSTGIIIVTSGYRGRRDWLYTLLRLDAAGAVTAERMTPADYRSRFAAVESL